MNFKKVLLMTLSMMLVAVAAFADVNGNNYIDPYASIAASIGIAIAAFGGALGQGKAASAALEGIARNPAAAGKLFVPMIIGLALIESLVIYAFLVTFVKVQTVVPLVTH